MDLVTKCSCCHQMYSVTAVMEEREVEVPEKLTLTVLVCPNCGNEIVTQVDNAASLKMYNEQLVLLQAIGKRNFKYGHATVSQMMRNEKLTTNIMKARNDLNGKYNHTSYQFGGKEHKLDIHVPNMKLSEG